MDDAQAQERLTDLWVEHRDAVAAFVRRRAPAALVEDAVAETFLVAWRRLGDVPPEALPWLFTVARNVLLTHLRTHGRWQALAVKIAQRPTVLAASAEDVALEALDLHRAWNLLSRGEREVLALTAWDGLTSAQAALVLGCRRSTFSVRLTRARRHFLDLVHEPPDQEPDPVAGAHHHLTPRRTP